MVISKGEEKMKKLAKTEKKYYSPKRIIFFTTGGRESPSARYRGIYISEELKKRGFSTKVIPPGHYYYYPIKESFIRIIRNALVDFIKRSIEVLRIKEYDILYIQKGMHAGPPLLPLFCKKVLRKGMIFDFDDAIFLNDPKRTKALVKISDVVIVGSHFLKEYAEKYNKNTFLIPTSINVKKFKIINKKEHSKIIIGWIGGTTTAKYLKLLVEPLRILGEKYDIEFRIYGLRGKHALLAPRFTNISTEIIDWIDEDKIPEEISKFDIGVMPLFNSDWEKGKCALKALEYMAMGIPTMCSAVGENNYVIKDGVNGFLCKNKTEWIDKLSILIEDKELRKKLGAEGRKTIEKKYSLEISGEKIANIIKEHLL